MKIRCSTREVFSNYLFRESRALRSYDKASETSVKEQITMETYQTLIDGIRQKCAAQRWYGAETYISDWRLTAIPENDPQRTSFAFAPATSEQIQQTERL